jgi:hypothetical protein
VPYRLVADFLEFRIPLARVYEKLEKESLSLFWDRPRKLLVRHSFSNSEMLGLLCHVIVVNVEHHMLPQLSLASRVGTATFTGGKEET